MRHPRILTLLGLALVALSSCDSRSPSEPAPPPTGEIATWDQDQKLPILAQTASGIVYQAPATAQGWCDPRDSAGVRIRRVHVDLYPSRADTARLRLRADDLLFLQAGETNVRGEGVVRYWNQWHRVSGTPGALEGAWEMSLRDSVEVLYGLVPDSTVARLRSQKQAFSDGLRQAGRASRLEISSSTLRFLLRFGEPAALEILAWRTYQEPSYDLLVERVDSHTVRFTGRTETVVLRFPDMKTRRYWSSDPRRPPYTAVNDPRSDIECPEAPWFDTFLYENLRRPVASR